jgi:hypothetical protein
LGKPLSSRIYNGLMPLTAHGQRSVLRLARPRALSSGDVVNFRGSVKTFAVCSDAAMSQSSPRPTLYKGYRFPPEIISRCVWLYDRFGVSLRDVSELMLARGLTSVGVQGLALRSTSFVTDLTSPAA